MNVRLQYDIDFMAGIYYEDSLQLNQYSVSLDLITKITDAEQTNIAMNRLKCFVWSELENTVFINQVHEKKAEMMSLLGINVTTLPEEPVDQLIGIMLYCKLNAIMEGRMIITDLNIQSTLGDQVWYLHNEEDALGPFVNDGWWTLPNTQHENIELETVSQNVVKVTTTGWQEYGLEWPDEVKHTANTVVFANFPKNEN
jgi:hypothetical protein